MIKELLYPFDADYILQKKKVIRRQLLESLDGEITKKIAILGGYTTTYIRQVLELFLLNNGIRPEFYESEYNQYYQDAIFDNEKLSNFEPDIIYVCTSNRNVAQYPSIGSESEEVDALLESEKEKYISIWESLRERYHCPIIQNNFELPYYRVMGNKEATDIHGKVNFLTRLNMDFYAYAQSHDNFYICDINYISADYGLKEWSDPFYYHMYKYAVNVSAIPYLAYNVANMIKSIYGKNKKGFVLDLDNTLWGGVIGDDGVDNIIIGPETSEGQAYLAFQRYLKEHERLGVLLNIDSKNDEVNALAGLKHPNSELRKKDFVAIKANWEPKSENFKQIANELSLLPESLLFIDDNPVERHIVTEQLPGVVAAEIGEPYQYIANIDRGGYFEVTTFSTDDRKRNEMYQENVKRQNLQSRFANYQDYLLSLKMKATIKPFEPIYLARIAQLSNKSNQFNLTTRRYTQSEIETIADDDDYISLYGKLEDCFGDNGVVSVVIGRIDEKKALSIDLWIMSCRVLKRDMEYAMMDTLVHRCQDCGIRQIRGFYYPTAKNAMVKDFYQVMGFTKLHEDIKGNSEWLFELRNGYNTKNNVINVEE